jgi:hypothetical protein
MTTVYDTMVLKSVKVTVKSRRTTTTTSTVTSSRIPRSGCSIQQGAITKTEETTRTTASSCPYIPEPTPDPALRDETEHTTLLGRGEDKAVDGIAPGTPPGTPPYQEQMTSLVPPLLQNRIADPDTPQKTDCKVPQRTIVIPVDPFEAGDIEALLKNFRFSEMINGQEVQTEIPYKKISAPNHKDSRGNEYIAGFALEWFTSELVKTVRDDPTLSSKVRLTRINHPLYYTYTVE